MELGQLLTAIVEVSQAVARMPCEAHDKNEVLDKIKNLFSCYTAMSNLITSSEKTNTTVAAKPKEEQTLLKQVCAAAAVTATGTSSELIEIQEKIQTMSQKLVSLEEKLNSREQREENIEIEESLSGLRSEFTTHVTALSQLRHAQDSISNRVSRIENKSNELEVLQRRVEEIGNSAVNRSCESKGFEDELLKIHAEIANLEGTIHKNDVKGPEQCVAFLASAQSNHFKYKAGKVIQFRKVLCNYNNCYDTNNSTFKAKFVGLYVFSASINTNSQGDFTAAIVYNGSEVALFGTNGDKDTQTGTSVVLYLNPNDTVSVRVNDQSDGRVGVEVGGGFSNFIGYKIA